MGREGNLTSWKWRTHHGVPRRPGAVSALAPLPIPIVTSSLTFSQEEGVPLPPFSFRFQSGGVGTPLPRIYCMVYSSGCVMLGMELMPGGLTMLTDRDELLGRVIGRNLL